MTSASMKSIPSISLINLLIKSFTTVDDQDVGKTQWKYCRRKGEWDKVANWHKKKAEKKEKRKAKAAGKNRSARSYLKHERQQKLEKMLNSSIYKAILLCDSLVE